jgi:hypothetical protein
MSLIHTKNVKFRPNGDAQQRVCTDFLFFYSNFYLLLAL